MAGLKDLFNSAQMWLEFRRDPTRFCMGVAGRGEEYYQQGDNLAAARQFLFVTAKIEEGYGIPADLAAFCYARAGTAIASIKPNPDPALAERLLREGVRRSAAMGAPAAETASLRINHGHALIDAERPKDALEQFLLAEAALPDNIDRLSGVADALQRMGDLNGAAEAWKRLIATLQPLPEDDRESIYTYAHERLGLLLIDAHQYAEAAKMLEVAVGRVPAFGLGLTSNRLHALASLTWVYGSLGRLEPAKAAASAWRKLVEEVGPQHTSPMQEVRLLSGLGWAHVLSKQGKEAVPIFTRAVAVMEETGTEDAFLLYRYGVALVEAGDVGRASEVCRRALAALDDPHSLIAFFVYGQLARHLISERRLDAGIFFHKMNLALRRSQTEAEATAAIAQAIDSGNDRFFRELGDAFISRGRLAEAEQIGRVLAEIELTGMIGRSLEFDPSQVVLTFTPVEEKWRSELEAALAKAQPSRAAGRSPAAGRGAPSPQEARAALRAWVDTLVDSDPLGGATHVNILELAGDKVPANVWLVKTLTAGGSFQVVVSAGDQKSIMVPEITVRDVAERVFLLRRALSEPGADVASHAGIFYQILGLGLIDRLRRDALTKATEAPADSAQMSAPEAPTLIAFDLDGPFRYLPIAALWDGDGWLIERAAVMRVGRELPVARAAAALRPGSKSLAGDAKPVAVAAFGTTKAHHGLPALPGVRDEITSIVRNGDKGALPGIAILDGAFTRKALAAATRLHPIVHIASHFEFHPSAPHRSGLLLGDGSVLTLQELWGHRIDFTGVRLVTLSACETGLAGWDSGSSINLATLVRMLGANAVAATLWRVNDQATARLMGHFYSALSKGTSPVEALRLSQLELLGRPARKWDEPRRDAPVASGSWAAPLDWSGVVVMGDVAAAQSAIINERTGSLVPVMPNVERSAGFED